MKLSARSPAKCTTNLDHILKNSAYENENYHAFPSTTAMQILGVQVHQDKQSCTIKPLHNKRTQQYDLIRRATVKPQMVYKK